MRYRNRIAFYISVALVTAGLFLLPPMRPIKFWAAGGILYLVGSISYFVFNFLLLGKLLVLRNATDIENKILVGISVTLGLAALAYGFWRNDVFAGSAGTALIYIALEFIIARKEPIPRAIGT
jgi:hypothetical protein